MRLDKFLSETNIASRKESKKIIKCKQIKINGVFAIDPAQQINESSDIIEYNGKIINYIKYGYYMLNKPAGLVSATEDNIQSTVIDLFKEEPFDNLFPVGRLDKDTTGLLIITNDGPLGHKLTSPSHHVSKTYLVHVEKPLSSDDIIKLENGIELKGDGITKPAKIEILSDNYIKMTIQEGKYHQVKRMLAAVSNKVLHLKRTSMGLLKLDETLKEGEYRPLTIEEINLLSKE